MSATKRIRACPTCCPNGGAYFYPTYAAPNQWECANCRHVVTIEPRKARIGSPKQDRVIGRIYGMLAKRFEVERADPDGYWAAKGVKALIARSRSVWANDSLLIYVGPRGSVKLTSCDDGRKRSGRDAMVWLGIVAL